MTTSNVDANRRLLHAIARAQSLCLASAHPGEVFNGLLNTVVDLTESQYGFIGEVLESTEGEPYIKVHAFTDNIWNDEMRSLFAEKVKEGLEFHNLETLFGAVIKTGQPVISNDPKSDPRRGGLPPGHPPIDRFLGLPLHGRESLLGIVGVANRSFPYDEALTEFLEPFLASCANILSAQRNEQRQRLSEAALRESELRYRHLIDSATDIIYETDAAGHFTFYNPIACKITGYGAEDLIGTHYLELVHPDHREDIERFYGRQYANRAPSSYYEFPLVTARGETVWLGQNVQLIQSEGEVKGYHAVARDITERKRVDAAFKESEARVRAVLESSHDPIVTIDTQGIIESVNPATERTFGYSREELVGQGVEILMPEPYRSEHASYVCNYLKTGNPKVIGTGREVTAVRKDGTLFPLELAVSEIHMDGLHLFTGIMRDITERKEAEKKIREALAEAETNRDAVLATLNQLRIGTVVLDENGAVEFLSDRVGQIEGVAPQSAVGKPWKELFPFAREIEQQIELVSRSPLKQRGRVPVSWKSESGKQYWLELEVRNDPRDDRKRIFYLYDVSQVHDLQLELDRQLVGKMVGNSAAMRKVYEMFQEVARGDWNVLVEGETGTGKELVARGIHAASSRKNAPFIAVNCAGLSESLVASQLFGHKRGAFTGAVSDQLGVFEAAAGGTVFLDEIGDVPPSVQTSLLRVLEQREIMRIGESKPRPVNVRIIAATHRGLEEEIEHGRFRRDLLYRLRVARVKIPPLRERTEDIPLLVAAFLAESRISTGKALTHVSSEAMSQLISYAWPGNVRELKNAVDYAAIHCKTSVLQTEDFPEEIRRSPGPTPRVDEPVQGERERILDALKRAGGNRSRAAKLLGVSRATLYRRLSDFGIVNSD